MNKIFFILTAFIISISSFSVEKEVSVIETSTVKKADFQNQDFIFFENLRKKWVDFMVGINSLDAVPKSTKENLINNYNKRSKELILNFNSDSEKKYLWKEIENMKDGNHIKKNFENLIILSKAYIFPGTEAYQNPEVKDIIISSLEWLNKNAYYIGANKYGNWWNWEIGIPKVLNEIIAYMYQEIPLELRKNILDTSYSFQPYPELSGVTIKNGKESYSQKRFSTGGNRLDTAFIVLVRGILSHDEKQFSDAIKAVPDVGEFVTAGDGFYLDGSFIQHDNVAYNGTYAAVLFSGLGNILNLTNGTDYEIKDSRLENLYKIIIEGYEPLLINGRVMDMVNGRSISRDNSNDLQKGRALLNAFAVISENISEPYKSKIKSIVKHNIESNHSYYLPDTIPDPTLKKIYDNLMKDESISYSKNPESKIYSNMDRVVHKRNDFSLGISMHSDRIANFETMNGENQKGWHTSDGATYLYTSDIGQHTNFWPTVDQYHLPGTTESINFRKNMSGERRFRNLTSPKSWVGGAGDGLNSIIGMDFVSWNNLTTAKKSWFLIGDVIVALGSNINSFDGEVHTTIDNRKLNGDEHKIYINGDELKEKISFESDDPIFFNLNNNWDNENLGYILLIGDKTIAIETSEKGSWNSLGGVSKEEIERAYFKLYIDHGKNPKNKKYAYILLPMKNMSAVNNFNTENIQILNLDSNYHAIADVEKNISGVNFWKNEKTSFDKFTSYNPLSLLVKEEGSILDLWLSDPTQHMKVKNILEIKGDYALTNSLEEDVILKNINGNTILEIDLQNKGKSINIKLEKLYKE